MGITFPFVPFLSTVMFGHMVIFNIIIYNSFKLFWLPLVDIFAFVCAPLICISRITAKLLSILLYLVECLMYYLGQDSSVRKVIDRDWLPEEAEIFRFAAVQIRCIVHQVSCLMGIMESVLRSNITRSWKYLFIYNYLLTLTAT